MQSRQDDRTGLRARAGDRLVIHPHHLGEPARDGEILEVLGEAGGPPFRVRWEDTGSETILFPGSDAFVDHLARDGRPRERAVEGRHLPEGLSPTPRSDGGASVRRTGTTKEEA